MKPTDNCEAFDMAIALWYWLSHWHGGISCPKYAAMCQITGEYSLANVPSIDMDEESEEDEMVKMYYHDLNEDNWQECMQDWCQYMDNEWEDN